MTDTTLVSKAAELPVSHQAHLRRAAVMLAVLDRLDGLQLPKIQRWASSSRDYNAESPAPAITGDLEFCWNLAQARVGVQAWADALGTQMTERIDLDNRSVVLAAAVEVEGIRVRVGTSMAADSRCPGCGGPAVGGTVLRHFTDAPCAPALQA